jgi:pimeloyl-ACP methyl ester carboxylesterase
MFYPDIQAALAKERHTTMLAEAAAARLARQDRETRRHHRIPGPPEVRRAAAASARKGKKSMNLDRRIREAETRLFARSGLKPQESFLDLAAARLRVLAVGAGPPLVMLHGVSLAAAIWAPWLADLAGYRALLVELPGHGLSGPVAYRPGAVRDHTVRLMDDLFEALDLSAAPVVGHSLGGMFALWYAAARPGRIASLVAIGDPAVALPGATVRMPLSLLTVPVLGGAVLRTPMPRPVYRGLLGQGLSPAAAAAAPDELLDVLRLAGHRSGNARTVASLMHAIDGFRRPRPDSVMTDGELGRIAVPTMFCWGAEDPFLSPARARASIAKIPGAALHEVPGGHGPWLEDSAGCAKLVADHFTATGFAPACSPPRDPALPVRGLPSSRQ